MHVERLDYTRLPPGPDTWPKTMHDRACRCDCDACVAAAWDHYKATNNPPRILTEEWSGPDAAWRFVVEGARYLRATFGSREAARSAAWRRYDQRVELARLWGRPGHEWEHWPAAYYWTDDEAGEALRGLGGGPAPSVLSTEPRALLDRLLRFAALARECRLREVGLDVATFTAARVLIRPGAEGRSVIEEAMVLTGLSFTCADNTRSVELEETCRTAARGIAASISLLSDKARAQGIRKPLVYIDTATNTLVLVDREHPGLSPLGPRRADEAVLASASFAPGNGVETDGGGIWK